MQIINLVWKGPCSYDDILDMTGPSDYGVYQICGTHPVYGSDTLLYIGKASRQTFGVRFQSYNYIENIFGDNTASIRIHTGRIHALKDEVSLRDPEWGNRIASAERLLIAANSPAQNGQGAGGLGENERQYRDYHVLNWGAFGRLLPEVSGARHTWEVWNQLKYDPVGT